MTLNTDVYVLDEVDPMEVFRFCQGLLAKFDDQHRPTSEQRFRQNANSINNEGMQGLPAWLCLDHGAGKPLRTAEEAAAHAEDCNLPGNPYYEADSEDCDGAGYSHRPACWLELDFDTAYGYSVNGMGCGDLHAVLVGELGEWLTGRGVRWLWQNEFTGEIHDDPKKLVELVSGGFEATAWFTTSVLPAILSGEIGGA